MTDSGAGVWHARADAYAASEVHARGASLVRLVELAAPVRGERAVDLGCGAGHTGGSLAVRGCTVTGVDLDEGMLAAARRTYPAVHFVRADASATGLPAASFDLACARHTLHHHEDPDATLREARRLLRPGGRFVLVDESALPPPLADWYEELERTRDPDHRSLRDASGWRLALRRAGFRPTVVDAHTSERIVVADWLARVGADPVRRETVRRMLRDAPEGAAAELGFETGDEGDVIAFAMAMVVAHATVPPVAKPDGAAPGDGAGTDDADHRGPHAAAQDRHEPALAASAPREVPQ